MRQNGEVSIGEDLRIDRERRRAGDPRLTADARALLRRLATGDLREQFQSELDAAAADDPALGGEHV